VLHEVIAKNEAAEPVDASRWRNVEIERGKSLRCGIRCL
jgi:hypothetical protein